METVGNNLGYNMNDRVVGISNGKDNKNRYKIEYKFR